MILSWSLFALYVVVTLFLAWLGQKKTTSLESYAVGDRNMSPWVVGLALAASMTSTATLVINPGIVYAYGLSGVLAYGVAAGIGLAVGVVVLSKGFRRHGVRERILTVPHWIGQRYGDRRLTLLYAAVNLLLLAMVVLICYAMAGLMLATLDLGSIFGRWAFEVALGGVVVFVFAYIFFGGTYAHAYTNTVQGVIMLAVAVVLVASGLHLFDGGFLDRLAAIDPVLAQPVNPGSLLFRNLFEVFGVNLVVGFALALQPHFLVKSLYVKGEREVNRYLAVAVGAGVVFSLVLLCGLYARIEASESVQQFMAASGMGIDGVMPAYIVHTFPPTLQVVISIALLAAGMSTLDGILVALSAIFANDVFLVLRHGVGNRQPVEPSPRELALAFRVGRYSLVGFGVLAFTLSLFQHYYKGFSVAIFAQEGVYALFAATFVPLAAGMFGKPLGKGVVVSASLAALAVHFAFRYGKLTLLTAADYTNPGLTATYALAVSLGVAAAGWLLARRPAREGAAG